MLGCVFFANTRMRKLAISTTSALLLPLPLADAFNATVVKHKTEKLINPKLSSEIVVHGFLLWVSMGVLMPLGIITIRVFSSGRRENCGRRLKMLFYAHVALQMVAVGLVTAGAIMSIKNFENAFNNNHQKIGLGLYGMTWLQPLIGYCRPQRGSKRRSLWFFVHWILGTATSLLGIINIYTGLHAYHIKTERSVSIWTMAFTVQVCVIALLYLFQDKWDYMKKQGVILENNVGLITPSTSTNIVQLNSSKDNRELSAPCLEAVRV
ncbi:hypothetical protein Sjap_026462 [Stephania japonica]|uniref:Cytochrome b561 domain-containing protein n=1 Tax=Stephania japonica TaxID=461633 RepID=A0AAP0E3N5_9MAGN